MGRRRATLGGAAGRSPGEQVWLIGGCPRLQSYLRLIQGRRLFKAATRFRVRMIAEEQVVTFAVVRSVRRCGTRTTCVESVRRPACDPARLRGGGRAAAGQIGRRAGESECRAHRSLGARRTAAHRARRRHRRRSEVAAACTTVSAARCCRATPRRAAVQADRRTVRLQRQTRPRERRLEREESSANAWRLTRAQDHLARPQDFDRVAAFGPFLSREASSAPSAGPERLADRA
jgi:hypothetical protein